MSRDFSIKSRYHLYIGVSADIGDRSHMEDEFVIIPNERGMFFFGIYDGHAGNQAARFTRQNLGKTFMNKLQTSKNVCQWKKTLSTVIQETYREIDREYFQIESDLLKQNLGMPYSGSTALSVYFNSEEGWGFAANAGDSRAILCKSGGIYTLSNDHRILRSGENTPERERTIAAGGWIEDGLLCGQLEPTRGIGDYDFKQFKAQKFPKSNFTGDLVICDPELEWFSLEETVINDQFTLGIETNHYSFIVLSTDGLWDCLSNAQVAALVTKHLKKTSQPITQDRVQHCCDELIKFCRQQSKLKKMAMDNTTITIVCFVKCEDQQHYTSSESSCLHCFQSRIPPNSTLLTSRADNLASVRKQKAKQNQRRNKRQKTKRKNKK